MTAEKIKEMGIKPKDNFFESRETSHGKASWLAVLLQGTFPHPGFSCPLRFLEQLAQEARA